MALTDLTRISTSGIATGTSLSGAILHGDAHFRGTQVGVTSALFDSSDNALEFNDNVKLKLGDSGEFEIFHRGTDGVSLINETGSAYLSLGSNGSKAEFYDMSNGRAMAEFFTGGACSFKHGATTRLETTSHGAVVTGILTATSFSGPIGNTSGISTFYNLRVSNNLTVEGTTTTLDTNLIDVDRVEIGANSNTDTAIVGIQSGSADIVNLFDGTTEVLTVKDGGNVGIGTDNPSQKLDVRGDIITYENSTGSVRLVNDGNIEITNNNGAIIDFKTADNEDFDCRIRQMSNGLQFMTGGNGSTDERLRILSTGDVGIGTDNPTKKLHVFDSSATSTTARDNTVARFLSNASNADCNIQLSNGVDHSAQIGIVGNGAEVYIAQDGVEKLRIDSSGHIGIGTDNPAGKLHISSGTSGDCVLILEADKDNNNENENPYIEFRQDGGIVESAIGMNPYGLDAENNSLVLANSVSPSSGIIFKTGTSNGYTNATERLRITSDGDIYTSNDQVRDDARLTITKNAVGISTILFLHNGNGSGTAAKISSSKGLVLGADVYANSGAAESFISFETDNNERLRISSGGAVGVGTDSDVAGIKLHVFDGIVNVSSATTDTRIQFNRKDTNATGWIGIPYWNDDGLYIYGPTSGGNEIAALYEGGAWNFHTAGNTTPKFVITSAGKIGINQINPYHVLDITSLGNDSNNKQYAGFEKKTENESGQQAFGLQIASQAETSSGKAPTAYIRLDARDPSLNGSHGGNAIMAYSPTGVTQGTYGKGNLDFYLRNGGSYTFINDPSTSGSTGEMEPRLRIASDGNIAMGTITPNSYSNQTTFTINGSQYGRLDLESAGQLRGSIWGTTSVLGVDAAGGGIHFYAGSANRGTIKTNGAFDFSNTDDNGVHSISNNWHGNHDFVNRSNRVLTSNGGGWRSGVDGADPLLVLSSSADTGRDPERGQNYGLLLHTESQVDNSYAPMIGFSNRSNSGTYNTTFAAILGKKIGQATDANWSTGQLEFYTNKPSSINSGYMNATPDMAISEKGYVTKPRHPAFCVKGTNMSRTNSDNFILEFNNDSSSGCFDNADNFNTTTHKFVAPVSGYYHFAANVRLDGWDSGYIRMAILSTSYHSGLSYWSYPSTGHIIKGRSAGGNRPYETFATSTTMYLPATHEAYVYMTVQNETSFTVYMQESSFSGHLIG